jgi:hypothetical protein
VVRIEKFQGLQQNITRKMYRIAQHQNDTWEFSEAADISGLKKAGCRTGPGNY